MDVLIVDDDPLHIGLMSFLIGSIPEVTVTAMPHAGEALDWCRGNQPDLVLVDYMMPDMDGLQFLAAFRSLAGQSEIPVIMATSDTDIKVRHEALQMGANDFLSKPLHPIELQARVKNMLTQRRSQLRLTRHASQLAEDVTRAIREIAAGEQEAILLLSRAAEYRDPETGAHLLRMSNYARLVARNLGLSDTEQELIRDAAPMHDIGKVGIPDHILLKPGAFDADEMAIMRTHTRIGADILKNSMSPLLRAARTIALTHHEKYDGSGYPDGLSGTAIPLYGRIAAVADVFDALTSLRPYKPAWEMERAAAFIRDGAGSHFDPACVRAFFMDWDAVLDIHRRHQGCWKWTGAGDRKGRTWKTASVLNC